MLNLCNIDTIKALLKRHSFQFSKSMGQNFLVESWVPLETAEASGATTGVGVLEIGPGIGPLTLALSDLAERVVAIELDTGLQPILTETLVHCENVEVVWGDVLKENVPKLCQERMPNLSWIVCANLPYNITTPVITAMIEANCFESITVMIQREVALRICAKPGTSDYGSFSVFCQYHADCELLYDVASTCFFPAPKVTSSVIHMKLRKKPPEEVEDPVLFFRVVRASFAQRRKTLVNGLFAVFGGEYTKDELGNLLESCNLSRDIRGERLGIPEFAQVAKLIAKKAQPADNGRASPSEGL